MNITVEIGDDTVPWSNGFETGTESIDSFLREVAQMSEPPGSLLATLRVGSTIANRYELLRPLGRGAHGVVWAARDSLTESEVAIKVLVPSTREQSARVRSEVASLRRLRIPGVVRLLDEGVEGGSVFLSMPFVRGRPFPGNKSPVAWSHLAPVAKSLLEAIAEVHLTGTVHCDLKPANVLCDGDGRTTILDFGLALAPTFGLRVRPNQIAGTPAYLAPEQVTGTHLEAPADLYAIGVMLYHALSGRFPHEAQDVRSLLAIKHSEPPSLATLRIEAPDHIARVIDSLLATDPSKRPASAAEAWAELEGNRVTPMPRSVPENVLPVDATAPFSLAFIRDLFEGRDRVSWIRQDAAALLYARSEGDPDRLHDEIASWLRAGVCRSNGGSPPRLIVDEEAVLFDFELTSSTDSREGNRVVERAKSLAESGRLDQAIKCLDTLLGDFRRAETWPISVAENALSLWVELALAVATPRALDRVLYEICRIGNSTKLIGQLEALVRAALAVGAWTDRALELASQLSSFDDPALELLRQGVRVSAARRTSLDRESALITELVPTVDAAAPPETRAATMGWLGRLKYREGHFEEAAKLHGEAALSSTWATRRTASLVSQASALTEAFLFDEASAVAERALQSSLETRHVYGRVQAECTARMLGYRRGVLTEPDLEWVEGAAGLRLAELEALASLTESSIAWRSNNLQIALTLATRAIDIWTSVGERGGGLLLASALAVACDRASVHQTHLESLADRAFNCTAPGVGIQVLGLIAESWSGPHHDKEQLHALAAQVPEKYWHLRIDILSVGEALSNIAIKYSSR